MGGGVVKMAEEIVLESATKASPKKIIKQLKLL